MADLILYSWQNEGAVTSVSALPLLLLPPPPPPAAPTWRPRWPRRSPCRPHLASTRWPRTHAPCVSIRPSATPFPGCPSLPVSPHASVLATGSTTKTLGSAVTAARCCAVSGCVHMNVFMAGHSTTGRETSQARSTQVWSREQRQAGSTKREDALEGGTAPQGRLGAHQKVVAEARGQLGERVGVQRRHDHDVRPLAQLPTPGGRPSTSRAGSVSRRAPQPTCRATRAAWADLNVQDGVAPGVPGLRPGDASPGRPPA